MRFIIEARIVEDESSSEPVLLRDVQQALVTQQVARWLQQRSVCDSCGTPYAHKDERAVAFRSIFGRLALPSPRWFKCACKNANTSRRSTLEPAGGSTA